MHLILTWDAATNVTIASHFFIFFLTVALSYFALSDRLIIQDQLLTEKQIRGELEISEAHYRRLFENMQGSMLLFDGQTGEITEVNPFFSTLFGYTKKEFFGKKLWEIGLFKDVELSKTAFHDLQNKNVIRFDDLQLETKAGLQITAMLTCKAYEVNGEKLIECYIRDVTKEKEVDKAKTEFVSLASHQLRTPLSTIRWYVEMLLSGDAGKVSVAQKNFLDEIYVANKRMTDLVNALLNVSRIEMGTLGIEPEPTDVIRLVDESLGGLLPQIKKRWLDIAREVDETLELVNVDPKLVSIIFQNLLENAVKYAPVHGKIFVEIKKEESDLLISVVNSGPAISAEDKSKIFTKFFRTQDAKNMDANGTGLGLYIVKSILEHSGGKIWLESPARAAAMRVGSGEGVAFHVKIPLAGMRRMKGTKN